MIPKGLKRKGSEVATSDPHFLTVLLLMRFGFGLSQGPKAKGRRLGFPLFMRVVATWQRLTRIWFRGLVLILEVPVTCCLLPVTWFLRSLPKPVPLPTPLPTF